MKDFAKSYPKLASNARDITSDADQIDNTSYETYLKGELLTYSEELLKLYAQFIVNLAREGKKSCIYDYRKYSTFTGICNIGSCRK